MMVGVGSNYAFIWIGHELTSFARRTETRDWHG
jgi:hypothetical protein